MHAYHFLFALDDLFRGEIGIAGGRILLGG